MKRKRIGIVFSNNENWIGGTYYILNLVSSFLQLDDANMPEVVVISWKKEDYEVVKKTGYPYVSFLNFYIPYTFWEKILNKFFPIYSKKNIKKYFKANEVDIVFPYNFQEKLIKIPNKVYWIPDFQEHFYPNFFSEFEVKQRKINQEKMAGQDGTIVFSSDAVNNDFHQIYPKAVCSTKIINFAVTHPPYQHLKIEDLKRKFNINKEYYFAPNQFWIHKNHITIIKSIKLLKEQGHEVLVVFTGKEYDYRNPTYTDDLKNFVKEHQLTDNILFLGFIDRDEQLQLMNHAKAVIQPSLFEGWSTVVEDAKAMNQYVIASDIKVHREQLDNNCSFFEAKDEVALSKLLYKLNQESDIVKQKNDYTLNIKRFAESFLQLIK